MVPPLLEALLLGVLSRRAAGTEVARPNRLAGPATRVDRLGHVADGTSVVLQQPGAAPQVLGAGRLLWPPLLSRGAGAYVVLTHEPVDVWLRSGPFETLDGRVVAQVELQLTVAIDDSAAALSSLVESLGTLDGLGDRLLDHLAQEVTDRTRTALRRRTLDDLTSLSLGVLLDGALPRTFLGGALGRTALEVVDVDWPTEGGRRPWVLPPALGPVDQLSGPAGAPDGPGGLAPRTR